MEERKGNGPAPDERPECGRPVYHNPEGCCRDDSPTWQRRLLIERTQLMERTIALKNCMESPDFKLSLKEWEMLQKQYELMRCYLQVLTDRCVYHNLIPHGDLGLHY